MRQVVGYSLVTAQFALSAPLVVTAKFNPPPFVCLIVAAFAAALAAWAWLVIGIRRLNVLPSVRADAELVTTPPYRLIRHPMYTSLLIFCGAFASTNPSGWKLGMWLLLAIDLDLKARLEERLLRHRFTEYESYYQRTWRFVPYLY